MSPEPPLEPVPASPNAYGAHRGDWPPVQDALAQTFAAILVQLRAAAELAATDPATAATFRHQAERLAEAGLAEARRGAAAEPDAGLAGALGRLARWADDQRVCACSFLDAGHAAVTPPAVAAAAYQVARALVVDAVACRALRRLDVVLDGGDGTLRLTLDGELVTDAPTGWLGRVRAQLHARVHAAAGTLAMTTRHDPPRVRVVAQFKTG